jgi:citrate lyase subunit beta/citryl-CoA lyase
MIPRSWLFTPGDSEKKIDKGIGSGADALILDLEDSVALSRKPAARDIAAAALRSLPRGGVEIWVRVNPLDGGFTLDDLAAVIPAAPDGIVLPKSNSGADAIKLANYLDAFEAATGLAPGQIKILPIATETAQSVFSIGTYATAGPRLLGLTWGAEDLPAAVGASGGRTPSGELSDLCRLVRSLCIAGAAAASVAAIDTVYPDFRDSGGLRAYATQGRRDGFVSMMAIHPAQVPIINEVMSPSTAEIAHAKQIIALFEADPQAGVVALDGKMLDLPHLKQARRVLALLRS